MYLSPHFTLEEMLFSQTASRLGIDNTPPAEALDNLRLLAAGLEQVRTLLGRPILISSGYRSPALNEAVGGSLSSAHILGLAVDFTSPPSQPLAVCKQIEASLIAFDQLIYEHEWVHFAIGPQRRRQVLTYQGAAGYSSGLI